MITDDNLEQHRNHLLKDWDLGRLTADLEKFKNSPLSPIETQCLYGLLSRYSIGTIAARLNWEISSVRTALSRGLYIYLKALLNLSNIRGSRVADWLEPIYGKQFADDGSRSSLGDRATVSLDEKYRARAIVATITSSRKKGYLQNDRSSGEIERQELQTLLSYARLRIASDDFPEALKIYIEVLDRYPLELHILSDIAKCLYELGWLEDAYEIANFSLCHGRKNHICARTHYLLGIIHRDWAYRENSYRYVRDAVYYLTRSHDLGLGISPVLEAIELLFDFGKERPNYLDRVELAVLEIVENIDRNSSDISSYTDIIYRTKDRLIACDPVWHNLFDRLENSQNVLPQSTRR
jgi:tetratricopeptide (TPR) repeat protein